MRFLGLAVLVGFGSACATTHVSSLRPDPDTAAIAANDGHVTEATTRPSVAAGPPTRDELNGVLAAGLGSLLARIRTTPQFDGDRFVGYRLDGADDLERWQAAGADVRIGDVIVRVNGVRIERPEQALWAFEQLRIVPAIEVRLLRDAAPIVVRVPIVASGASTARN